jgi:hypothetical protein
MARLNGISISNNKVNETDRWVAYSTTLYVYGIKIDAFENIGNGGVTNIWIEKEHRNVFLEKV